MAGIGSGAQFQNIAISDRMIRADLLAVGLAVAPVAGVFQRLRQIAVNQPGHVAHGLSAAHGERSLQIRRFARRFGVNPHDAEFAKQPRTEMRLLISPCR
jgi:hypothetical protein